MCYTTVLALEFAPALFERLRWQRAWQITHKITLPLVIIGILLSTMHQSSLGSLWLIAPGKLNDLWYTPLAAGLLLDFGDRGRAGHGDRWSRT